MALMEGTAYERASTKSPLVSNFYLRRLLERSLKRTMDVIGALVLLILLSPVFLVLAVVISLEGGAPIYAHRRVGRNGQVFRCLKFRTMLTDAEICLKSYLHYHPQAAVEWARDQKLAYDPRTTALGVILRRTSLDELPQLWNVLIGEMSLVGPRPVTPVEMHERYQQHAELVTSIRPGLTGVWQVSGRNDMPYSDRVMLDVRYVQSQTLLSDIRILFLTLPCMLARNGK